MQQKAHTAIHELHLISYLSTGLPYYKWYIIIDYCLHIKTKDQCYNNIDITRANKIKLACNIHISLMLLWYR